MEERRQSWMSFSAEQKNPVLEGSRTKTLPQKQNPNTNTKTGGIKK